MQDIAFKNSRKLTLQGSLWADSSDAIIIMAHGSAGNRFAKGLFKQIAENLHKDYSILAFDFSGHGASDDDILTIEKAADDVKSAISWAKKQGYTKIILMGHSLGALACLQAYTPDVQTMILMGALTGPVQWSWDNKLTPEQAACLKQNGYISLSINDEFRKELKVDGNLLRDIRAVDQKKLLTNIHCPILIIHGNADQDEKDLFAVSTRGEKWLPAHSKIEVIDRATHDFLTAIPEVIALIKNWLHHY